jgi:SAM-dependent methyltransferase
MNQESNSSRATVASEPAGKIQHATLPLDRKTSFGFHDLKPLERLGVWMSHRAVARIVGKYQSPRLLDLGSGYQCRLLKYFRRQLGPSTAVDLQLDQTEQKDLTLIESRIEDAWPQLPAEAFDMVTAINVLEHVWEPGRFLIEAARRLKPGGTLIVNVPTWLGKTAHELQAFRLGLSSAIEIDDHKWYFDKRDLWPLLVQAGFKPSRILLRYHKFHLNLFAAARRE